ncbi:PIN domain-containing protein [Thermococcus radiotolerans]|uniref:PIN domain-containing protein n=1 Tax=Thermococcus radiotolerans TaxID=187880 RepID=UPI000B5A0CB4|nr:PIN domain-containing protein [Thermococcus radiotolerans]
MRENILLVVNTNVLFSFFGKSTTTRELIFLLSGRLISPEFAIKELYEHKDVITRKARISSEDFEFLISTLREHVMFVGEEFYAEFIPVALEITPDKDDVDFIALSLKVNAPLWSNDKRLKEVNEVQVLTTKEVLKLLGIN